MLHRIVQLAIAYALSVNDRKKLNLNSYDFNVELIVTARQANGELITATDQINVVEGLPSTYSETIRNSAGQIISFVPGSSKNRRKAERDSLVKSFPEAKAKLDQAIANLEQTVANMPDVPAMEDIARHVNQLSYGFSPAMARVMQEINNGEFKQTPLTPHVGGSILDFSIVPDDSAEIDKRIADATTPPGPTTLKEMIKTMPTAPITPFFGIPGSVKPEKLDVTKTSPDWVEITNTNSGEEMLKRLDESGYQAPGPIITEEHADQLKAEAEAVEVERKVVKARKSRAKKGDNDTQSA